MSNYEVFNASKEHIVAMIIIQAFIEFHQTQRRWKIFLKILYDLFLQVSRRS